MSLTQNEIPAVISLAGNPIWVDYSTDEFAEDFIGIHYSIYAYLDAVYQLLGSEMRYEPDSANKVIRDIHAILEWDPEKEFTWPEYVNAIIVKRNDLRRLYKIEVAEKYGNPLATDDTDTVSNLYVLPGKVSDLRQGLFNDNSRTWLSFQQDSIRFLTNAPKPKKTDAWTLERLYFLNISSLNTILKVNIEINYDDDSSTSYIREEISGVSQYDVYEIISSYSTLDIQSIDPIKTILSYKLWLTGLVDVFTDWFLPSIDLWTEIYNNLFLFGVGELDGSGYWSSSEDSTTEAWSIAIFLGGLTFTKGKGELASIRSVRVFGDTPGAYSLRDEGPAGGWICYIDGGTYYELAPHDNVFGDWSNVTALLIGTTGTAIGTGISNTAAIIAQPGHTVSAAKECDDLIVNNPNPTPLSEVFTFYIDHIQKSDTRRFLFSNAYKMIEGIRFTGDAQESANYSFQESRRNFQKGYGVSDPSNIKSNTSEQEFIEISSEWLTKDEMDWYREIQLSKEVYEIVNGQLIPISIISTSNILNEDNSNLRAMNIQYKYAHEDSVPGIIAEPPLIVSAEVGNVADNKLILTYDKDLNESVIPAVGDWSVDDGAANAVTDAEIDGKVITLTLTNDVDFGDTVIISYTSGANKLQDLEGNVAANLVEYRVENNIPFSLLIANYSGTQIEIDFQLPVGKSITLFWGDGNNSLINGNGVINVRATSIYIDNDAYSVRLTGDFDEITLINTLDSAVGGSITEWGSELKSLSSFSADGNNTFDGSIEKFLLLTYLFLRGANAITGSIELLIYLTYIRVEGNNTLSGVMSNLILLIYLNIAGNNTISGVSSNSILLITFFLKGNNVVSGTIQFMIALEHLEVTGSNILAFDLNDTPLDVFAFYLTTNQINTYTSGHDWSSITAFFTMNPAVGYGLDSNEIDNLYIDFDNSGISNLPIETTGSNAAPTAASAPARANLTGRGCTIITN